MDMVSQNFSQNSLKKMGACMVQGNGFSALPVHLQNSRHPFFHFSSLYLHLMDGQLSRRLDGILYFQRELLMKDHASIPYLAASFPVKGGLLRNHFDFIPFGCERNNFIAFDQSQDP